MAPFAAQPRLARRSYAIDRISICLRSALHFFSYKLQHYRRCGGWHYRPCEIPIDNLWTLVGSRRYCKESVRSSVASLV